MRKEEKIGGGAGAGEWLGGTFFGRLGSHENRERKG